MLTVEKIGGTSMSALTEVLENIIFYDRSGEELYNRVFVVSAFSGVTNLLLENKKTKEPGVYHRIANYEDFHGLLNELVAKLKSINQQYEPLGLDLAAADAFIEKHVKKAQSYLENLVDVLASGYVSKEGILQAAREILASIGETHSAFNLSNILQKKGVNARFIDLSGFDDQRPFTIDQRIRDVFPILIWLPAFASLPAMPKVLKVSCASLTGVTPKLPSAKLPRYLSQLRPSFIKNTIYLLPTPALLGLITASL